MRSYYIFYFLKSVFFCWKLCKFYTPINIYLSLTYYYYFFVIGVSIKFVIIILKIIFTIITLISLCFLKSLILLSFTLLQYYFFFRVDIFWSNFLKNIYQRTGNLKSYKHSETNMQNNNVYFLLISVSFENKLSKKVQLLV